MTTTQPRWTIAGTDRTPAGIDPVTGHITPNAIAALIVTTCGPTAAARTIAAAQGPEVDQAAATIIADVTASTARKAAAVGLPDITRGDPVTYRDTDGATRHGTFVRVDEYGHRRGRQFLVTDRKVVVRTSTGDDVYAAHPVTRAAAPALPACTNREFTPRGRCTVCRIHKTNHAAVGP